MGTRSDDAGPADLARGGALRPNGPAAPEGRIGRQLQHRKALAPAAIRRHRLEASGWAIFTGTDDVAWETHLSRTRVTGIAAAPDGAVWVATAEPPNFLHYTGELSLYVILPVDEGE